MFSLKVLPKTVLGWEFSLKSKVCRANVGASLKTKTLVFGQGFHGICDKYCKVLRLAIIETRKISPIIAISRFCTRNYCKKAKIAMNFTYHFYQLKFYISESCISFFSKGNLYIFLYQESVREQHNEHYVTFDSLDSLPKETIPKLSLSYKLSLQRSVQNFFEECSHHFTRRSLYG